MTLWIIYGCCEEWVVCINDGTHTRRTLNRDSIWFNLLSHTPFHNIPKQSLRFDLTYFTFFHHFQIVVFSTDFFLLFFEFSKKRYSFVRVASIETVDSGLKKPLTTNSFPERNPFSFHFIQPIEGNKPGLPGTNKWKGQKLFPKRPNPQK